MHQAATRPCPCPLLVLILFVLILALAASPATCPAAGPATPLNVIVVMTDDQGYGDIAAHGNPVVRTPAMDLLHAQSVRLTDFHVNPFCSPTRAALMTGRMADRTGVTSTAFQGNFLRRTEVVMPEFFRASGYRTAIFGKWHLGGNHPYRPIDRGFDRWLGLGDTGLATTSDFWDNDRLDDTCWSDGTPVRREGFCTDVSFDAAIGFIDDSRKAGKPFFAYIATNVPHWDWNVRPEWLEHHKGRVPHRQACFYASVERADWNLGRLLDHLRRTGLDRTTLLIFLTDNGSDVPDNDRAFSAGMRGWKGMPYEGGHRVPCFIRGPENVVGQPRDIDAFTAHVDLLPTLVDLCGLAAPPRRHLPWDGRSLRPLLTGDGSWPDRTLVMHLQNGVPRPTRGVAALVMTSRWRLINGTELYDMQNDRSQRRDVAAAHPDVVQQLRRGYDEHWDDLRWEAHPAERPVLGGPDGPTLKLTSDNTRDGNFLWQRDVRLGTPLRNPTWLVEVDRPGRYRCEVRRWPREVDVPMTAGLPPAADARLVACGRPESALDVPGAALGIAAVELTLAPGGTLRRAVAAAASGVSFTAELPAGPVDLEAWFLDADGKRMSGAYYVYAEPAP